MNKNAYKLSDVVEIIDGDRGKNYPKQNDFLNDGFCLFLNTKNVPSNHFDFTQAMFVDEERDGLLRKGKIQRGDFVLTTRGTIGNFAHYSDDIPYDHIRINSGMVIMRIKDEKILDSDYFNLYLDSIEFKNQLRSRVSGSAQPQLPIRDLSTFEIELPDPADQKKISSYSLNYSNLYWNNLRRIKILEEMTQAIYTEWFVNLKFPGHEKVKLVDSKTDFSLIPEGWKIKKLRDAGMVVTGKTPPKSDKDNFGNDVPFIKTPDLHGQMFCVETNEKLSRKGADLQKNKYIPQNTLIVSCIGTVGVVSITTQESQTNQQINALIPNEDSFLEYGYFVLKGLKKHLQNLGANGATMGNVNKGKFENIEILTPSKVVLNEFHTITSQIFRLIENIQRQNIYLMKNRDLLIPKLVTGEVEIKA